MSEGDVFRDRLEAGRALAAHLEGRLAGKADTVVLAIPRGGVLVAAPVARALAAALDIVVPRKIGAPGDAELAVGAVAVADGEEIVIVSEALCQQLGVGRGYLEEEARRQRREIERRVAAYRGDRPAERLGGRRVVLVDDGVATGQTARAAARAVGRAGPSEVVVAVPVAPLGTMEAFAREGLRLEALVGARELFSVSQFYEDFHAVGDDEVRDVLGSCWLARE